MASRELYRSKDGRVTVDDTEGIVSMRVDGRLQSSIRGVDGLDAVQPYLDYLHLPFAVVPEAARVLVIGLGGGVLPKRILHDYPAVRVDAVELDPQVVEIARRYFGLPEEDRLDVIVSDGRRYLEETDRRYDVIVVDAYDGASMPFALTTLEFVRLAASRLSPGGVLTFNFVGVLSGKGSRMSHRFLKGMRTVFSGCWVFPVGVGCGGRRQNIVVLASDTPVEEATLRERIRDRVGGMVRVPGFENFGDRMVVDLPLRGVRPLTDAETPEGGTLDA